MAHYHKSRGQQKAKWERFTRRYGMSVKEFRALKKSDPVQAQKLRERAHQTFLNEK